MACKKEARVWVWASSLRRVQVIAPTERAVARTGVSCAGQPPGRPKDLQALSVSQPPTIQATSCQEKACIPVIPTP